MRNDLERRQLLLLELELERRRRVAARADARRADPEYPGRTLEAFIREGAWDVLEPGTPLLWNWHLTGYCNVLEAVSRGEIRHLVSLVGPGLMKSLTVAVFWPAWEWTFNPGLRTLYGSYALDLALRDSLRCRELIESDWYQQTFEPQWGLKRDQNAKSSFENTAQGFRMALSVGARTTGFRGHRVVVDDPLNAVDAFSEIKKEKAWTWYSRALSTRVNDPKKAQYVLNMQRLAHDDPAGYRIKRGGCTIFRLPMEFDPKDRCVVPEANFADPRTEPGELLFPDLFPPEVVADLKETLGPDFEPQYNQRTFEEEGKRFRRAWFRRYTRKGGLIILHRPEGDVPHPEQQCSFFATLDSAASVKESADYTVLAIWCVTPSSDLVLIDFFRERVTDPEAVAVAKDMYQSYRLMAIGVEDNGLGLPRLQNLQFAGLPAHAIHKNTDKIANCVTAVVRMSQGQVFWPTYEDNPRIRDWEEEHLLFPDAPHDDMVDNTSMAADMVYTMGMDAGTFKGATARATARLPEERYEETRRRAREIANERSGDRTRPSPRSILERMGN